MRRVSGERTRLSEREHDVLLLLADGLSAGEILFVSSNGWDALGASWYGYTTLWVNRAGLPPEQLDMPPTRTGTSLRDVLDFFASSMP